MIESGLGKSAVIKSHHNVGGLPDVVDFKEIIEPLRMLFKDEVRKAGLELGIPEYLVYRQPFLALVLVSVSSAKLPKRKLRSYRKQITFTAKKLPRQALTKVLDSTLQH